MEVVEEEASSASMEAFTGFVEASIRLHGSDVSFRESGGSFRGSG